MRAKVPLGTGRRIYGQLASSYRTDAAENRKVSGAEPHYRGIDE